MNWRNVRLIFMREMRDQLRDRRTLFMIAVLPLLLYPLLGMSMFQLSQFLRTTVPRVLVVGSEQLRETAGLPPLFEESRFAAGLFNEPGGAERFELAFSQGDESGAALQQRLQAGDVEVVLQFPGDFGARLTELRAAVVADTRGDENLNEGAPGAPSADDIPQPELLFNSAREKSSIASAQVEQVLQSWRAQIIRENLRASRVPAAIARPFELRPRNIAELREQQARLWSKILPFVLFIWALTGAFYPAVDLCAGEKERGTLETLLSSPALRSEIVWGKLLTVMTFSAATALLNLASLGVTAQFIIGQLQQVSPLAEQMKDLDLPPLGALLWLLVALVPMSALFSALCLASAAFARSTKEGQYYLMPLLLVMMPLMMLPMAPGTELNLGNSLIPVTGVVLLSRSLVQGDYGEALRYFLPVCIVTIVCCRLAIRWAVYQFNQESIIFREGERFDLRRWFVHLVRDRQETPSLAGAFFCVAVIYVIQFFTGLTVSANLPPNPKFGFLVLVLFVSQVVCFALPALCMTLILTDRPAKSLLLDRWPRPAACAAAVLLAVLCLPAGLRLAEWVQELYPLQKEVADQFQMLHDMLKSAPYVWLPYLLMALLPAICEEMAFRGFVLSGLRHLGNRWWAIGLSAVFFGIAHTVMQQSISAAAMGFVIGYLAVQCGSLIPCILFHLTYNSAVFTLPRLAELAKERPALAWFIEVGAPDEFKFGWPTVVLASLGAAVLLGWFHRLPYQATMEEALSDARARQAELPLAGGAE
jgi:sodium transport system permease protein